MIKDLIKQREEIDLKIKDLKREEPVFQSFQRIKKLEKLIVSTRKIIGYEMSDNPFISKMVKYGFNTDLSLFPAKLRFTHIEEDKSFDYDLTSEEICNVVGDVNVRVLQGVLKVIKWIF